MLPSTKDSFLSSRFILLYQHVNICQFYFSNANSEQVGKMTFAIRMLKIFHITYAIILFQKLTLYLSFLTCESHSKNNHLICYTVACKAIRENRHTVASHKYSLKLYISRTLIPRNSCHDVFFPICQICKLSSQK